VGTERGTLRQYLSLRHGPTRWVLFLAAAVLGFTLVRLLWLDTIVYRDEAAGGYVGMLWSRGLPPYVNCLDNKTPIFYGIYLIHIKLFGNNIIPVRLFNDLLFVVSLLAVYRIALPWFGARAAVLALLLYGFALNMPIFDGQLAIADSLSMPFLVFSFLFCTRYINRDGEGAKADAFLAGLFLSVAVLIHPVRLVGIIPLAYALSYGFLRLRRANTGFLQSSARFIPHVSAAVLGFALPAAGVLLELLREGALDDALAVAQRNAATHRVINPDVTFGHYFMIIVEGLPIWVMAFIGSLVLLRRAGYRAGFVFASLIPTLLVILYLTPRFGHRFQAILPMAAIAGGLAVDHLISLYSRRRRRNYVGTFLRATALSGLIGIVLLTVVPSIWLQAKHFPNYNIHWQFIDWDWAFAESYDQQLTIANYLKEHAKPEDRILLHGWFPELYWLSGYQAPSIFVYSYRGPGVDISDDEYNKLVQGVKTGEFAYVGFLDWSSDEVIDAVRSRYSLETTIGSGRYRFLLYSNPTPPEPVAGTRPSFLLASNSSSTWNCSTSGSSWADRIQVAFEGQDCHGSFCLHYRFQGRLGEELTETSVTLSTD